MEFDRQVTEARDIVFILDRQQGETALARHVAEAVPYARVYVGPSLNTGSPRLVSVLLRLERLLFRYPGRSSGAAVEPMPDDIALVDLIVDLRPGHLNDDLSAKARMGVWRLGEFDLAAVVRGETSVTVPLICHSVGEKDPKVLAEFTIQSKVLTERTREFATEKAVQLIRREIARISLGGAHADLGPTRGRPLSVRNRDFFAYVFRVSLALFRKASIKLQGGREKRGAFSLRVGAGEPDAFRPEDSKSIPRQHLGWLADPFLLEHEQNLYCFYEDLPPGQKNGSIKVARVSSNQFDVLGSALQTSYHLSYPFVFKHEGDVYMIPETLAANRIEVWKAADFPKRWELHSTALDGQGFADPVLFEYNGDWWLFASPCHDSLGDFSSELWVFRASGPDLSRLEPHPLNPVVVGSDTARGGGRISMINGRLLRFSQDNSGNTYGYGLNAMEITELSTVSYRERRVRHITPDDVPGTVGCHHIDFHDGQFIMDVRLP